jgi:hypothetical protein
MWYLVPPKAGVNIIDCKWVYKVKKKSGDIIDRYKSTPSDQGIKEGTELIIKIQ